MLIMYEGYQNIRENFKKKDSQTPHTNTPNAQGNLNENVTYEKETVKIMQ